ncbi:hypothetical protein D6D13_00682 [Aureobasidium pullulans]|uniref:Uncharacterized protein n=1 Tax=Aureobasidium pullulans TaxID=5580 RepID=A0A4S9DAS4_AURPU|nr:hypothetical protein D6D13_00682 [Aureobasidium pullulans]
MCIPRSTFLAEDFIISCGTVTFDPKLERYLIIVRVTPMQGEGRKRIDETLLDCALRSTYEVTGISVDPALLPVHTNAPPLPVEDMVQINTRMNGHEESVEESSVSRVKTSREDWWLREDNILDFNASDVHMSEEASHEPIAVTQRINSSNHLEQTFWFGAQAESSKYPCPSWEQFQLHQNGSVERTLPIWVTWERAVDNLSRESDKDVMRYMDDLVAINNVVMELEIEG